MKELFLFVLCLTSSLNTNSQSDLNYIDRKNFYIIRTDSALNDYSKISFSELNSTTIAEQLFGKIFKAKEYLNNMNDEPFTSMVYDDGLELYIPDVGHLSGDIIFHVTSDKYIMLLTTGQTIKVGMKASDLEDIFPISFSKRKVITNIYGKIGKIAFAVFFSFYRDGKLYVEDSYLGFTLSEDGRFLEEFYSYEPG